MRGMSVRGISDRLREADFHVERVTSRDDEAAISVSGPDRKNELERVLDALAVGYETDVLETDDGDYDVFLKEMG